MYLNTNDARLLKHKVMDLQNKRKEDDTRINGLRD